jgi:hypothetical protein
MKDKLLGWAFEFLLTKDTAKKLAHSLTKKLQEKAALTDGKQKIAGYLRDSMATVAVFSEAVADDGKISDAERAKIDTQVDSLIDKYIK